MNIYKKLLLVIFSGLWTYAAFAQDSNPLATSAFFKAPIIGRSYVAPAIGNGSPYLLEGWCSGNIVLNSYDTVNVEHLRFDCLRNELIWTKDGQIFISIDNNLIRGFSLLVNKSLSARKFEKVSLKLPFIMDTMVRFIETVVEGKMNVYALRNVSIESESVAGKNGGLYFLPVYVPEPVFYVQLGDLQVKKVKLNKQSLVEAYPEYSDSIRQILRSRHMGKIKQEYQLIEAVRLINDNL